MTKNIEDDTRRQIGACLPDAVARAIDHYRFFLDTDSPGDPKDFRVFQDACKAAITHLDELIELAQWVDANGGDDADQKALALMLEKATQELKDHQPKEQ